MNTLAIEDVAVGTLVPPLRKGPVSVQDLVKFAAASDDYSEIHFDEAAARARRMPGPIVHGPLKAAWLAEMLVAWCGSASALTKLTCRYGKVDVAGETLTCRGKVTAIAQHEPHVVECEVWTENGSGEVTTTGTATLQLGSRASASGARGTSLITDAMRRELRLGEVAGTFVYDVDANWIRRFAAAFGDANPLWRDEDYARCEGRFRGIVAPPTFFAALDPVETKELLLDDWVEKIPYRNTGGGNAFNEVEYFLPVRAGDRITVEVTYTDVFERDGRSGRLLFRIRENMLRNQDGGLVARARSGHIRSYDVSSPREGAT